VGRAARGEHDHLFKTMEMENSRLLAKKPGVAEGAWLLRTNVLL